MRKLQFSIFAIMVIVANCVLIACSGDKDNPETPGNGKCVISEVTEVNEDYSTLFSNYQFDKDGRITAYKKVYSDEVGTYGSSYSYNATTIRVSDYDNDVRATYVLEDGLIVSGQNTYHKFEYSYDKDKRITSIKNYDIDGKSSDTYTCNWENGNLTSYTWISDDGYEKKYTIKYNSNPNTLKLFPVDIFDGYLDDGDGVIFDAVLCAQGYFGTMPVNFISEISGGPQQYKDTYQFTYADFNKYGYPSKMSITENGSYEWATYNFTWKM